jgi:CyaY protein
MDTLDEHGFAQQAEAFFLRLEEVLDDKELDYDVKAAGVVEIEFENGSKIIVNRHSIAKEIWIAARSGGFHFHWENGQWLSGRDNSELWACLSICVSEQSGEVIVLS